MTSKRCSLAWHARMHDGSATPCLRKTELSAPYRQACAYGATSLPIVSTPNASLCLPCPSAPSQRVPDHQKPSLRMAVQLRVLPRRKPVCLATPGALPSQLHRTFLGAVPSVMPWAPTGSYLNSVNKGTRQLDATSSCLQGSPHAETRKHINLYIRTSVSKQDRRSDTRGRVHALYRPHLPDDLTLQHVIQRADLPGGCMLMSRLGCK